jgi:tRNA-Thr(GGU) m(6)t(6)A37 methyltransferase TsaA
MGNRQDVFEVFPVGVIERANHGLQIKVFEPFIPALKGLEHFSHVIVFWWCHLFDNKEERKELECEKPYRNGPEKIGIFATRSPTRPNPLAITVVSISNIDHEYGTIRIPYIDAEIGTPVIDLKPYHPSADRVRDVSVPEWCSHWPKWYEDSAKFDWESEENV